MFGLQHLIGFFIIGLSLAAEHTGPVVVGQTFLAGSTNPTTGSTPWSLISHGIAEKLFTVDKKGEIVPQIAESVVKVSDKLWEVTLKSGYKYSNGETVTAQHVVDCLTELNEKNAAARASLGKITVIAPSGSKVRIESAISTHVMDAVLAEWVFVIYLKDSNSNFVFTGPYAVETFADTEIKLTPNRFYDNRSLDRPTIMLRKFPDGHELAKGVKNSTVDIGFHLPIDTLPDLRKVSGVNIKSFEVGYHYMMFHNIDRLPDLRVRKAIDLAIDRIALSQALAGGKATRSLFPDFSPYFQDDSDQHGQKDAAKALLDQAGWTLNSDGKREKDGNVLTLNLVAYPHRPGLVIMQPFIKDQLTDLGINVVTTLTSMTWSDTQKIIDDRNFDLLMWAQHTLPAGDPMAFLSSFFRSNGGSNHANLKSNDIDKSLDTLSITDVHTERVSLTKSIQGDILAQVPVSNLVTPYWHISVSDRMGNYEPWGSDYYVIRSDIFVKEVAVEDTLSPTPAPTPAPSSPAFSIGHNAIRLMPVSIIGFILCIFV